MSHRDHKQERLPRGCREGSHVALAHGPPNSRSRGSLKSLLFCLRETRLWTTQPSRIIPAFSPSVLFKRRRQAQPFIRILDPMGGGGGGVRRQVSWADNTPQEERVFRRVCQT